MMSLSLVNVHVEVVCLTHLSSQNRLFISRMRNVIAQFFPVPVVEGPSCKHAHHSVISRLLNVHIKHAPRVFCHQSAETHNNAYMYYYYGTLLILFVHIIVYFLYTYYYFLFSTNHKMCIACRKVEA